MAKKNIIPLAELREKYGRPMTEYIPSGLTLLDDLIGGGIPTGKYIEFHSDAGYGKTTLVLQVCRNILEKKLGRILYMDVENALDESLRDSIGITKFEADHKDKPSFMYTCPGTYNEVANVMRSALESDYNIVVCDSIGNISLDLEDNDVEVIKSKIGQHALKQGELTKTFKALFARTGRVFIVINQMRANITLMGRGAALKPAGGKVLDHNLDIRIGITKKEWIKDDATGDRIGAVLYLTTIKNKVAMPFRQVEVDLYFGLGVDKVSSLMKMLEKKGFIRQSAGRYTVEGIEKSLHGKDAVKELLRKEYDKYAKMLGGFVEKVDIEGGRYEEGD